MECKIILGLSVISALLYFASGTVITTKCIEQPADREQGPLEQCSQRWKRLGKEVLNDTSLESQNEEMHCYTKCLYEKMGIFYDHQFHIWAIREIMMNYVHHPLSEKLEKLHIQSAEKVNANGGDDCEMTKEFWFYTNTGEGKDLKNIIFCGSNPWLNPEEVVIPVAFGDKKFEEINDK